MQSEIASKRRCLFKMERGSIELKQAEIASKRQEDELQNLRSKVGLILFLK